MMVVDELLLLTVRAADTGGLSENPCWGISS